MVALVEVCFFVIPAMHLEVTGAGNEHWVFWIVGICNSYLMFRLNNPPRFV